MVTQKSHESPRRSSGSRTWRFIIIALVILFVGAGAGLWAQHRNSTDTASNVTPAARTANSNTKGEPTIPNPTTGTDDKNAGDSQATLTAPQGNFVSNHHPNLGGSPAPNSEQSVCSTTPGASCQIIFTKDGVTKTLAAQTTDSGGATYWDWTLQQVGLTEGSWHVSAKATLANQAQTADDALTLEVAP